MIAGIFSTLAYIVIVLVLVGVIAGVALGGRFRR